MQNNPQLLNEPFRMLAMTALNGPANRRTCITWKTRSVGHHQIQPAIFTALSERYAKLPDHGRRSAAVHQSSRAPVAPRSELQTRLKGRDVRLGLCDPPPKGPHGIQLDAKVPRYL
jgi:hypothetical protein